MEARFQKALHVFKSCHLRADLGEFALGQRSPTNGRRRVCRETGYERAGLSNCEAGLASKPQNTQPTNRIRAVTSLAANTYRFGQ